MSEHTILSPETIAKVEQAHPDLLSPESKGTRKVSAGLLNPPASNSRSSSGTFTGSSRSSESPEAKRVITISKTPKITIPTYLNSVETYEFLGFTTDTATALLSNQKAQQNPLDVARAWIENKCDYAKERVDNWSNAMEDAGVKEEVRLSMLKPEHEMILYTQPLKYWLIEIFDTAYEALVDLEANILLQLGDEAKLRGGGSNLEDDAEYTIPQMPGGHIAVFKSVDGRATRNVIREDGSVSLARLESYFQTDFARRGGLYFTHQLWVAKAYSKLINDACNAADRRTVELHVPLSHFKDIGLWKLEYGDDWKQLIYHSRREELLPKALQKIKADHGCIQGPIAQSHTKTLVKLESWKDIGRQHLLTKEVEGEDGTKQTMIGIQQVWFGEEAIAALEAAVFEKGYVRLPEKGFRKVAEPWEDLKHLK